MTNFILDDCLKHNIVERDVNGFVYYGWRSDNDPIHVDCNDDEMNKWLIERMKEKWGVE